MKRVLSFGAVALVLLASACILFEPFPEIDYGRDSGLDGQSPEREVPDATNGCGPLEARECTDESGLCKGRSPCQPDGTWGPCDARKAATEVCDTNVDENCDGQTLCIGDHRSVVQLGDGVWQQGLGIATDASGDVIVVGAFLGQLTMPGRAPLEQAGNGATLDGFVVKITRQGTVKWARALRDGVLTAVATSTTMVAVAGYADADAALDGCPPLTHSAPSNRDILVATYTHDGACIGVRTWGSPGTSEADEASAIAIEPSGGAIDVGGQFRSTLTLGGTAPALVSSNSVSSFLARLDANLVPKHALAVDTVSGRSWPRALAVDHKGNAVLVGAFAGTIDLGGSGFTRVSAGYDFFLLGMSANGTANARMAGGGPGNQEATAVAFDSSDNLLLGGTFVDAFSEQGWGAALTAVSTSPEIFLFKRPWPVVGFSAPTWGNRIGGPGAESLRAIAVDAADNIILVGAAEGSVSFGGPALTTAGTDVGKVDAFAAKLKPNGDHAWSFLVGDNRDQSADAVATDPWGDVLFTGAFSGTSKLSPTGPEVTANGGGQNPDVLVIRRGP